LLQPAKRLGRAAAAQQGHTDGLVGANLIGELLLGRNLVGQPGADQFQPHAT